MSCVRDPGRRRFITAGGAAVGAALLAGCDPLATSPNIRALLASAEKLTLAAQRLIVPRTALAREYTEADLSPYFRANGSVDPHDADYRALAARDFAEWRLEIGGLVERPTSLSLDEIRALPARTQITRHDCVEGWSCIGKWTGVPLRSILKRVGLGPRARYIVFYCYDDMERSQDGSGRYYESIDLVDAFHPQTILAHALNDQPLRIAYGAPLRLRVERQLGYKMAKYLHRIEAVESLAPIGRGKGGFWEDRGYEWYAGI